MTNEVASLDIAVNASSADQAALSLDKLAQSGGRAEGAVKGVGQSAGQAAPPVAQLESRIDSLMASIDPLYTAQRRLDAELREASSLYKLGAISSSDYARALNVLEGRQADLIRSQARLNQVQDQAARSTGVLRNESLNLTRQFTDVGVSIASGSPIYMVLIQQGAQIAESFAVASAAGIGFRGVLTGIYATLAPLLPLLAGVAAAAGAIAAPFAIGAQQINAANDDLIEGLGLTADQLENVKNQGVTMGDVLTGTWVVTSKALTDAFGPEIEAVKNFFADLYQGIVDGAVLALRSVVGGFTGAAAAIRTTWSIVPSALGDAAVSAANAVLRSIGGMVNNGILALNVLIAAANRAADAIPGVEAFIPFLNPVNVLQLSNPFEGALRRVGTEGGQAFLEGFQRGAGRVQNFLDDVARESADAARRRILREAGEATGSAARGGGSNAREAQEVVRFLQEANVQVRALNISIPEILDPLEVMVRELRLIDDLSRRAGQGLAEAFGAPGAALAGITDALSAYRLQLAEINLAERENRLTGAQASRERAAAEIQSFGDMASAAKGFFDERSAGYRALLAVEQAYRAIQFANAVKAMVLDKTETGSTVAMNAIKAASHGVVAVARAIASLPFPLNLAAGAATAAAIGALGISIAGGGRGGGGAPTLPTTNTGTGTVLGDSGAQSESLTRSLDTAERYQNRDLEYSSRMVASLRSIQDNIGSLTTAIARETGIGGGLNPAGLNQGPTTSGGFLGLFATTRSSSVVDSGINLTGGQLADLIARGVSGSLYQIVQTTRTNSGFFGIGGGTRTTNSEVNSGIGQDLSQELSRVLASLRDGVLTAAGQLGLTGAEAVLDAFQVNLGRISFDGLSSAEISQTLNAVFSAVGDDMAAAILPGLAAFQQAGEGLFETLSRLATEYRTVDLTLASIGMTFRTVGLESIEARTRLVELSGGLEAFVEGTSFFAENFLTEAQRIAPIQAAVTAELERLGIATDITRTGFADLVMGLDVSTEAGAAMYAALIALAPALDRVLTYQEEITGAVVNTAELDRQRRELEIRLMEAQGETAAALALRRADELAAMDASLRPLQEAIWAAEDMARAAAELAEAERQAAEAQRVLAQQRRDLEIQLMEATGDAAGALAARRQLELAALDESLRPLQEAIWAALDLAAANDALARAQADAAAAAEAEAQRVAQLTASRRNLEIDLLDAQGRSAEAVAARRALELEALDASLRPLQEAIYAALDLAAAAEALADAQARAAEEARAEAERLANIARQQRSLDIQLLEATGDAAGALAARRQDELAALDESLRATQLAIWAAQDLAAANQAAATAQQEAAAAAQRLASQRASLEIELLEATGQSVEALARRRQQELDQLDESLRPIQLQIYAAQDLAEAQARAAEEQAAAARAAEEAARAYADLQRDAIDRVEQARSDLTSAYQREAGALRDTIDTFRDFGASIRAFRAGLDTAEGAGGSYAAARSAFEQTAALARLGNQEALGNLTGASQTFLDAALNNASSSAAYNRDVGLVKAALEAAAGTADRNVTVAEQQLAALDASVDGLITLNESVLSVRDGISALQAAIMDARRYGVTQFAEGGVFTSPTMFRMGGSLGQLGEAGPEAIMPLVSGPNGLGVRAQSDGELISEVRALRQEIAELKSAAVQTTVNTGRTARASERHLDLFDRVSDGGEAVITEAAA